MSQISTVFGSQPGLTSEIDSFENKIMWGIQAQLKWVSASIYSGAIDSGNSPTTRLRSGLVMAYSTTLGQWTNYDPAGSGGAQIARGILGYPMNMINVLTGSAQAKFYALCTGGNVLASQLYNLDGMARAQMAYQFTFDDTLGYTDGWFPTPNFVGKTADYTIVAGDIGTEFHNAAAGSTAINFTLPTLANGLHFRFRVIADASLTVTSAEGTNMVALNNASASSVAFSTSSQKIGGGFWIYANQAATKWLVANISAGTNTITVA